MIEENKFRPFLIGIVDGSLENQITKQLLSKLEGYQICSIYMSNYLIDGAENESVPEFIDFELLEDHLLKLLINKSIPSILSIPYILDNSEKLGFISSVFKHNSSPFKFLICHLHSRIEYNKKECIF